VTRWLRRDGLSRYATLTYGIGFERHRLGWLEWMVAQLQ